MNRIKYIFHPDYTLTQWQQRNPVLGDGEVAFVKDGTNKSYAMKVGPGAFNDLPFFAGGTYPYPDAVTNPIGDAKGVLLGKSSNEILNLMLNPYQVPVLSAARNNGGVVAGPLSNEIVKEIGTSLNTNVQVQYNRTNQSNLLAGLPINVDSGGAFSNDGNFADGVINMVPAGTISPSMQQTIEIKLKAFHQQGVTNQVSTFLKWKPKLITGVSELEDLNSDADVNALLARTTQLTDTAEVDVIFGAGKFQYILIPGMLLGSETLAFTDRTNPEAPATVEFIAKGALLHNNGVGTYVYQKYRSSFYMTVQQSRYRIRKNV